MLRTRSCAHTWQEAVPTKKSATTKSHPCIRVDDPKTLRTLVGGASPPPNPDIRVDDPGTIWTTSEELPKSLCDFGDMLALAQVSRNSFGNLTPPRKTHFRKFPWKSGPGETATVKRPGKLGCPEQDNLDYLLDYCEAARLGTCAFVGQVLRGAFR